MGVHGQMPVGKLRALISTGNKQDWFEWNQMPHDCNVKARGELQSDVQEDGEMDDEVPCSGDPDRDHSVG